MPTIRLYQTNYPRQREELREEARVLAWFEAIAARGYYLTERREDFFDRWVEGGRAHTLSSGLSPQAREAIHTFCHGEGERLQCKAYPLADGLLLDLALIYPKGAVVLTVDDGYFSVPETGTQSYILFLDLIELTYRQWHPLYGFDYAPVPGVPNTTREDALALEARCLYHINVFGPEFVAKLGRERLLSAPVWQRRELDDGGLLVATIPYMEENRREKKPYNPREAARLLGLPSVDDLVIVNPQAAHRPPPNPAGQ